MIEPELLKKLKALEGEAVLLAEKDDIDGAIAKFTEVIDLCPTYASGYNNRYVRASLPTLHRSVNIRPWPCSNSMLTHICLELHDGRAQAYRIQDNTAAAIQDLDKAIEYGNGQIAILKQVLFLPWMYCFLLIRRIASDGLRCQSSKYIGIHTARHHQEAERRQGWCPGRF